MKKKGFTLVELLAVIVILGIVLTIAIPKIILTMEDVRKNAYKVDVSNIIDMAKTYATSYFGGSLTDDELEFNCNGTKCSSGLNDLNIDGKIPLSGSVFVTSDGKASVENLYNGEFYANASNAKLITLSDTEEPTYTRAELAEMISDMQDEIDTLSTTVSTLQSNNQTLTSTINSLSSTDPFLDSHPVGSIYVTVASDESTIAQMHTKHGGTWEVYGAGRTLVSLNTADTSFDTINETGGEKTHTLTVAEMPSHNHSFERPKWKNSDASTNTLAGYNVYGVDSDSIIQAYIDTERIHNSGSSEAHNNLQPYITVYMYKRTA